MSLFWKCREEKYSNKVFILRYFPFCFIYYIHKICDMCWMLLSRCERNSVVRQCWSEWAISLIFTELQITNFPPRRWKHTKHSLCLDSIKQSWLHSPPCGAGEGGEGGEEGEVALCWSTVETLSSYLIVAGLLTVYSNTLWGLHSAALFSQPAPVSLRQVGSFRLCSGGRNKKAKVKFIQHFTRNVPVTREASRDSSVE